MGTMFFFLKKTELIMRLSQDILHLHLQFSLKLLNTEIKQ